MEQRSFSDEELHKLIVYRRWLFIGFPVGMVFLFFSIWFVAHYIFRLEDGADIGLLGLIGLGFTPIAFIYCLSKYKEAVRKTTHRLAVQRLNLSLFNKNSENNNLFESKLQECGLLPQDGYIEWHNFLQGNKENIHFSLQDMSWMVVQGRTREYSTKAQYTLLTIVPNSQIGCNILIRKNKLLKFGIKNLNRVELQDNEFEKMYDAYTDKTDKVFALLNPLFVQTLMRYIQISKKQPEFMITPNAIFVFYNTGVWKKLFSLVIFRHPRVQCNKILKEITDILDILPAVALLENPQV